jgi:hypothetical protein
VIPVGILAAIIMRTAVYGTISFISFRAW